MSEIIQIASGVTTCDLLQAGNKPDTTYCMSEVKKFPASWNRHEYVLLILTVVSFALGIACFVNAFLSAARNSRPVTLSDISELSTIVGQLVEWVGLGIGFVAAGGLSALIMFAVRAIALHIDGVTEAIVAGHAQAATKP